ncbi:hypothetical protein HMPREF0731_1557 [Pseudoroseomonas cervicalis ATCC 49957]|uniref:Uncharacterized protein n=1 Tax=Pseudoroseomonas cervicalis ATCC 49957 TaxID=525371 RepID=D5RKE7_9PROT|nr:hypothetical protein HMPREF0731_1557 [Pseudoroseomonas cervicalis ATCC 49957]
MGQFALIRVKSGEGSGGPPRAFPDAESQEVLFLKKRTKKLLSV